MAVTLNANTSTGFIATSDTSGVLQLQTAGTAALTIDASANVGIGTASPTTKLDNTGSFRSTGATDPTSGTGLELSYRSTYGDVLAYNRTSSTFAELQIRGAPIIFGNAGGERMRIDSSGNVGIGTSSPDGKLHVSDASTGTTLRVVNTSSSSGSRALIRLVSATSTFGSALFQTNGTDASYTTSALNLYAFDSQPLVFGTNNTERMRISAAGDVGIGTNSPATYKLDVRGNAGFSTYTGSDYQLAAVSPSGADRQVFLAAVSGVSNGLTVRYVSGAMQYTLTGLANGTVSSSGGVLSASSDQDKKVADGEVLSAIDKVLSLKPRYFYWKDTDGNANEEAGRQLGFFAQEVNTVVPEASPEPKGKDEGWGIYDRSLVATLTAAIQEQQAIITSLTDRITALEGTTP